MRIMFSSLVILVAAALAMPALLGNTAPVAPTEVPTVMVDDQGRAVASVNDYLSQLATPQTYQAIAAADHLRF